MPSSRGCAPRVAWRWSRGLPRASGSRWATRRAPSRCSPRRAPSTPIRGRCSTAQVEALEQAGRAQEALASASDAQRLYPRDPRLYALQSKTYATLGKRFLQHQAQAEVYALQGSLPAAIEQLQLARSANDGDFYQQSVVDARIKELRAAHAQELKDLKR